MTLIANLLENLRAGPAQCVTITRLFREFACREPRRTRVCSLQPSLRTDRLLADLEESRPRIAEQSMSIAEAEAWLCALQVEAAAYAIDEWKLLFGSLVAAAPEIQGALKRHDVPVDLILTRHSRRHRTVRRVKDHPDESRLDALARRLEDICEGNNILD